MRIAIVGTGIAGNAAAWALSGRHAITVYEKDLRAGGHSHTIAVDYPSPGGAPRRGIG